MPKYCKLQHTQRDGFCVKFSRFMKKREIQEL